MSNENYGKNPDQKLEEVLQTCLWQRVVKRLWEKAGVRLYVDTAGVFLFQRTNGVWARTHGLAHNRIVLKGRRIVFKDGSTLNLSSGELDESPW